MRERNRWQVVVAAFVASCASQEVDPRADEEQARELIRAATGATEMHDPDAPPRAPERDLAALYDGLGLDEALRFALVENRRLQAEFAALGVARADFVQAGLLRNPSLGIGFLLPSGGGRTKFTAELTQRLVDVWELPARQHVAEEATRRRIFEVSAFAAALVADTKDAYYRSVAADQLRESARESHRVARALLQAVEERVDAGAASSVERSLARNRALGAELSLLRADRERASSRRDLAGLLSLEGDLLDIALTDSLPTPVLATLDREALVARTRATRLDVRASHGQVRIAQAELELARSRTRPNVDVGVAFERPEGGAAVDSLIGPGASLELPLFDSHEVQVRRAEYRLRQVTREHEALVAEVGQQVRVAVDQAIVAVRSARFVLDELLPEAERAAALARTAYELGDTTVLALLEGEQAELEARRVSVEALLEATRADIEVERSAGASLASLSDVGDEPPPAEERP